MVEKKKANGVCRIQLSTVIHSGRKNCVVDSRGVLETIIGQQVFTVVSFLDKCMPWYRRGMQRT